MPDKLRPNRPSDHTVLSRKMLSEQIKDYIVDAILNGKLKAGDRIVESALASQLGVSQAPVREAIRELIAMGFLETEPYKGTSVRTFTSQDLHDVYTVRAALEALAGRMAATRITDENLIELRTIMDEMLEAARQNDLHLMVQKNNLFHNTILEISGNHLLYKLYQTLQFAQWTIFTTMTIRLGLEFLAYRHEALLDAFATHTPEVVADAMRKHIEELGSPLESIYEHTIVDLSAA
jgi:DNA-binding GntR family transcriptional regulator